MTVAELIVRLKECEPTWEVWHYGGSMGLHQAVETVEAESFEGHGPVVVELR